MDGAIQKLFDSFEKFRTTRRDWRKLIDRTDEINLGTLYHDVGLRYHSFKPQHELNQFTAVLDTASTTFSVNARTEKAEDKEAAQNWEHWLNAAVLYMTAISDALRLSRSERTSIGVGIWKFDLKREWLKREMETDGDYSTRLRKDWENRLKLGLPFVWSSINPLTCAWFRDAEGIPVFVEQSMRPINPILKEFQQGYEDGAFLDLGEGEPVDQGVSTMMEQVKFTQVSTNETISYYVESKGDEKGQKLLKSYPNPWGRPPYVVVEGLLQAGSTEVDTRYIPLIMGALVQAKYDNFIESITFLAAYLTGTPVYDVFTKEGQPYIDPSTNQPMVIEVKPGAPMVTALPPGAELRQRTIAMGVDMDKMRLRLREDAEKYGFPSGLAGQAPEPRTPAYALAEAQGKAMLFIEPATKAEQRAFVEMAEMLGHVIKNYIQEEIPILSRVEDEKGEAKALTVGSDDIGDFDIKVGVTVPSTSLQLAKQEMMRKDVEDGFLSPETYQTDGIGIKDVERENRLIIADGLKKKLIPSIETHAMQISQERIKARLGSSIPVPQGAVSEQGPPAAAPTRPAQQVRPVESEPNPLLEGVP